MSSQEELISVVNEAFDGARFRLRLRNDEELARHYEVAPKTISEWRNGKWTKADKVLITLLVSARQAPATSIPV